MKLSLLAALAFAVLVASPCCATDVITMTTPDGARSITIGWAVDQAGSWNTNSWYHEVRLESDKDGGGERDEDSTGAFGLTGN